MAARSIDPLPPDTVLSHYRIVEVLGEGGMGVVYRAVDERLNRVVALKVIGQDAAAADLRRRFIKEARAASAFTHPNIVTIHEVDTAGDIDFIVMELLSGRSLDKQIAPQGLPIDEAVSIAEQIAAALAAAHAAGIVHRDIKPANVMVSDAGHVKLLDFGIAKQLAAPAGADAATSSGTDPTMPGAVLGSVPYMSPEQAQGHAIDGRSDVFGFGILLYEMLTGRRPFSGTTSLEMVAKILEATPPAVEATRTDVPLPLASLLSRCLEKDRNRRPQAADVLAQLTAIRRSRDASNAGLIESLTRRAVAIPALIVLAIGAVGGGWWWASGREMRVARRQLPVVLEYASQGDGRFYAAAAALIELLPDDAQLRSAWANNTFVVPQMTSTPPDADVYAKGFGASDSEWVRLGRTPLEQPHFPFGTTARVRIVKEGYVSYDGTMTLSFANTALQPAATAPSGMVYVPGGDVSVDGSPAGVTPFWLDKLEVTNREFKAFLDAGGYSNREYWKESISNDGRTMAWEDAMAKFRDRTGRPGPSTWELGTFPEGQGDYPVGGVSWYEAAAYAAFAGKQLPTAYQWRKAGDFTGPSALFGDILVHSNFNGKGPVRVGSLSSVGPYGQLDMAGNVKEWCWNEAAGGRMILGGSWNEPKYMFEDRDAQPPMHREATYGFRLVRNITAQPATSFAFMRRPARDYSNEKPIDDRAFALVTGLYAYDHRPLNDRLEKTEETPDWRHETVTLDAAYADERVIVHMYLPKNAAPPYQPVAYFPGGDSQLLRSSRELNLNNVDFVIRSGRALVYPVYKGTYERVVQVSGMNAYRDLTIARVKDFRRVADYLATRADIRVDQLGYYGVSLGAFNGTIIGALEPRVKAIIFMGGGLARSVFPPEIDPLNFVPRIRVPTLMVNGMSDFQYPLEAVQRPEFRLLGPPPEQKRHALFDGGHIPNKMHDVIREILDWLDRFLGPVKTMSVRLTD